MREQRRVGTDTRLQRHLLGRYVGDAGVGLIVHEQSVGLAQRRVDVLHLRAGRLHLLGDRLAPGVALVGFGHLTLERAAAQL